MRSTARQRNATRILALAAILTPALLFSTSALHAQC